MQVSKWGNSLAIRIPEMVVEALQLQEGDEVEIRVAKARVMEIARDDERKKARAVVQSFSRKLPMDWRFDRDEANAR